MGEKRGERGRKGTNAFAANGRGRNRERSQPVVPSSWEEGLEVVETNKVRLLLNV
jgi:hypothetical protein